MTKIASIWFLKKKLKIVEKRYQIRNYAEKTRCTCVEVLKFPSYLALCMKTNFKWITDLNVISETVRRKQRILIKLKFSVQLRK